MPSYYQTRIRYQRPVDELPTRKKAKKPQVVTEVYVFDAVSHTDAEARLIAHVASNTPDFQIPYIHPYPLSDLFRYESGEYWYKCKIVYTTEDERTGKEKKVVNTMLVNADTPDQAADRIRESLKNMLMPFEVKDIVQTPILDVVDFVAAE